MANKQREDKVMTYKWNKITLFSSEEVAEFLNSLDSDISDSAKVVVTNDSSRTSLGIFYVWYKVKE